MTSGDLWRLVYESVHGPFSDEDAAFIADSVTQKVTVHIQPKDGGNQ